MMIRLPPGHERKVVCFDLAVMILPSTGCPSEFESSAAILNETRRRGNYSGTNAKVEGTSGHRAGRISTEFEQGIGSAVEIAAAPRNFGSVLEEDAVFAVKPGLQFLDAFDVDDLRAIGADEFRRIEFLI